MAAILRSLSHRQKKPSKARFPVQQIFDQKLLRPPEEKPPSVREIRTAYAKWLCDLWTQLRKQTNHQIGIEELANFGITYDRLELSNKTWLLYHTFFAPDVETLKKLQADPNQWNYQEIMDDVFGEWSEPFDSQFYWEVNQDNARGLCRMFQFAFATFEWQEDGGKDEIILQDSTDWREVDFTEAFDYGDWLASGFWYNRMWDSQPENVWVAKNHPHIMATIAHGYSSDNRALLLGEIQVIIALMIVRLASNSLPDHNIVPVLVFSFTGDKQGRILQAYMNYENLVIRASKFYDFSAKKDTHLDLFLRYMIGDLRGSTKTSLLPNLKPIVTDVDPGFVPA
ncbi:hypothetical protein ZTR_10092 [Talaromyces verruculosus]|nr:hypothetical protein ZTR_10092 [Talaromyces verruculosus]